jgi:Sulfotransferase family
MPESGSKPTPAGGPVGATPRLLYVGGFGRSGSTLVGRVLGQAPGALCVGETCYLATRGLLENVQCGCGTPFRDCSFWGEVGERAFGGWEAVDTERLVEADRLTSRYRTLPRQPGIGYRKELAASTRFYVDWLRDLFDAIGEVSHAKMIIETSKDPWFAGLLTRMHNRDVRIIHLVRDSRAVAYSWTRSKQAPGPVGQQNYMPKFRPFNAAVRWSIANTSFHLLSREASAYARIGYEKFVADPRGTLRGLGATAGSPVDLPWSELTGDSVLLSDHHIFSGNPMRDRTGWLEMRIDDEWRSRLPLRQVAEVTAVTWPLLGLYGYPLRAGVGAARAR